MIFETKPMRWHSKSDEYQYNGPEYARGYYTSCREGIMAKGWVLPPLTVLHSLVLVFSTTPVEDASQCNPESLSYAGMYALLPYTRTIGRDTVGGFETLTERARIREFASRVTRTLWWWPEVITYG